MVDVAAFVKAVAPEGELEASEITYGIGRHALADLAHQFRLEPVPVDRLGDEDFDHLFDIVDQASVATVERETARRRLRELRSHYEPNAEALAEFLALDLPSWFPQDGAELRTRKQRLAHQDRDLVG
jgi:hypothetical protein